MENMFAPLLYSSLLNIDITKRARELLTWVGILDKEHAYAKEMSGGQQKLLEFARALMADPEIILFDEPFAGVHPNLKNVMMERMLDLKKMGKTIILVSHDMPSLYMLTQEIIVLHQGAFLARGTPQELKENEEVVSAYLGEGRN
jgi:branched-chain amino acid transport system ATP-binding protein